MSQLENVIYWLQSGCRDSSAIMYVCERQLARSEVTHMPITSDPAYKALRDQDRISSSGALLGNKN
jgi:hypothetical protein